MINEQTKESKIELFDWYDKTTDTVKCLECNKWFKVLPGHLRSHHITSSEYRERWGIWKTTPLSSRSFIDNRRDAMNELRSQGKAVVSPKGVQPPQLKGYSDNTPRKPFKEFEQQIANMSKLHKGKVVSEESRLKNSLAHKGKPAWNKTDPVTRSCKRCDKEFTCMCWQPNQYCSKSCAMLSNKNWLKRKVLL